MTDDTELRGFAIIAEVHALIMDKRAARVARDTAAGELQRLTDKNKETNDLALREAHHLARTPPEDQAARATLEPHIARANQKRRKLLEEIEPLQARITAANRVIHDADER